MLVLLLACAPDPREEPGLIAFPKAAPVDTADSGESGEDTCAEASGSGGGGGGPGGEDHGSPENRPYSIDAFDDVRNCAGCHPDHYDQWHGSVHAASAINPLMWKGSQQIGETTDDPLVCAGCHVPIGTLTGVMPMDRPTGSADGLPEAARRGVSCVSCHKLYDVVNGVNQFTHCEDWYAGTIQDPVATTAHVSHESPIHAQSLVCRSCHNVENLNGVQVEFTYTEWDELNRAAGGTEEEPAIPTCQDCHMPSYTGTAATGGPERVVHRHDFLGGDLALGPFADTHAQEAGVRALMRDAATLDLVPTDAGVTATVTNVIDGHDLPTGSAFDRQVWVEITATDADGNLLLSSGDRDANGDLRDEHSTLDPEGDPYVTARQSIFRSYLYDASGAETFDFIGATVRVDDQTLASGESRSIDYTFDTGAPRPIAVEARVLYRPYPPFLLREKGIEEPIVAALPIYTITQATAVLE